MDREIVKLMADTTTVMAVSGGAFSSMLAFLNVNAAGLGVLISLFGIGVAAVFYTYTYRQNAEKKENQTYIALNHKRIKELEEKLKDLSPK